MNNLYYIKIDAIPCQLEAATSGDRIQKVDLLRGRGQLQGETLPGFAERGEKRKGDGVETRMGMKPAFGCVVLDGGLAMLNTNLTFLSLIPAHSCCNLPYRHGPNRIKLANDRPKPLILEVIR